MRSNILVFLTLLILLSSSQLPNKSDKKATVLFYLHKNMYTSKANLIILNSDKYVVSLNRKTNYHIEKFTAGEQLFWTQVIDKHSYTKELKTNETYVVYLRIKANGIYPGVEIKTLNISDLHKLKKRDQKKILEILNNESLIIDSH
jgi:hypothetical protein